VPLSRCAELAGGRDRFRRQAAAASVPSMRQKIDIVELYADARAALPTANDGQPPLWCRTCAGDAAIFSRMGRDHPAALLTWRTAR